MILPTPRLILVAGISCSGKTTLASRLTEEFEALHISMDDYYRSFDGMTLEEKRAVNFDAPDAVEHRLLFDHLSALKAGMPVHRPIYDHAGFDRVGTELVSPRAVVVFEGLFSLYWPEILALADVSVFVDTPVSVCLERRLFRDTFEFNRTREDSLNRYVNHVIPNQDRFVLPTRDAADAIVNGEDDLELTVDRVREMLFESDLIGNKHPR